MSTLNVKAERLHFSHILMVWFKICCDGDMDTETFGPNFVGVCVCLCVSHMYKSLMCLFFFFLYPNSEAGCNCVFEKCYKSKAVIIIIHYYYYEKVSLQGQGSTHRCTRPPRRRAPSACSQRWRCRGRGLRRSRTPSWCWRWAPRRAAGSAQGSGPIATGSQGRPAPGCQTPPHLRRRRGRTSQQRKRMEKRKDGSLKQHSPRQKSCIY